MTETEFERQVQEQGEAYEQRVRSAVHVLVVPNSYDEALAAAALILYGEEQGEAVEFWMAGNDVLPWRLAGLAKLFAPTRSKRARHLHLLGQDPRGLPNEFGDTLNALAGKHFEIHWYLPKAWMCPKFDAAVDYVTVREAFVDDAVDRWRMDRSSNAVRHLLRGASDSGRRESFRDAIDKYRLERTPTIVPEAIRAMAASAAAGRSDTAVRGAQQVHYDPHGKRRFAAAVITGESASAKSLARSVLQAADSPSPVLVTGPSADLVADYLLERRHMRTRTETVVGTEHAEAGAKTSQDVDAEFLRRRAGGKAQEPVAVFLKAVDQWREPEQVRFAALIRDFQWGGGPECGFKFIGTCLGDPAKLPSSLFHTLAVHLVRVPALRERVEDIPKIREQLLATTNDRPRDALAATVKQQLLAWPWPGDYDELFGVLAGLRSGVADLGSLLKPRGGQTPTCWHQGGALPTMSEIEQEAVRQALYVCGGNVSKAALMLRISRSTLRRIAGRNVDQAGEPTDGD